MSENENQPRMAFTPRTCHNQFPDLRVPREILDLAERGVLGDTSWRDDVCASFEAYKGEKAGLRLWVDYPDAARRSRYGATRGETASA